MTDKQEITARIKSKIADKGGNASEVARLLGISSQRLGKYVRGTEPGITFSKLWWKTFSEELLPLDGETKVSRETISSKQPDPSPEQVPGLLYGAIKELVSATQQIAENTRKEPRSGLGKLNDKLNRDKPSGMDKKNKV